MCKLRSKPEKVNFTERNNVKFHEHVKGGDDGTSRNAIWTLLQVWEPGKISKYNWLTQLKVLLQVPTDNIKDKLLVLNAAEALEKKKGLNNI